MELLLSGAMLVSLTFYMLTGGADYGGGVWELFARGSRGGKQRELISNAIGPIWEANHVWLILVIVILFTAFPRAFALISTSLHIPLSLMLIGIVLRGSAFAFRSYDTGPSRLRWGFIFAAASAITPVLLGITIGAIASGNINTHAFDFYRMFVQPWLSPFSISVGFLTLSLFAQLAAVYLTVEANDYELQEDFRRRAMVISFLVLILAVAVYLLAENGAHFVYMKLHHGSFSVILKASAVLITALYFFALWSRKFRIARIACAGQAVIILWGWALAQFPYLIVPQVTVFDAAPRATLSLVFWGLMLGSLLLFPSFFYLFKVFKSSRRVE